MLKKILILNTAYWIKPGHMAKINKDYKKKRSTGCLPYWPSLNRYQTVVHVFIGTVPCGLDYKSSCKSNYCCKLKISSSLKQYQPVILIRFLFFWSQTSSVQTSQTADETNLQYSRVILQHNQKRYFFGSINTHLGVYFL